MLDQDSTGQGDTEVVGEDTNMNSEDNDNKRESETGGTERPVWVDDEFNDQMDCTDKDDDW
jgi:hypothetical protein